MVKCFDHCLLILSLFNCFASMLRNNERLLKTVERMLKNRRFGEWFDQLMKEFDVTLKTFE